LATNADSGGRRVNATESREWLLRCEGFQVDGPSGYVGIVLSVVYDFSARWDRPSALKVRGSAGDVTVPIGDVEEVFPEQGRLVVARALGAAEPAGPDQPV
jgi:hypothetical protein